MLKILAPFLILLLCFGFTLTADLKVNLLTGRWYLMYADKATVSPSLNNNISCVIADVSVIGEELLNVTVWLQSNGTNVTIESRALHDGQPFTSTLTVTFFEDPTSTSVIYDVIKFSDIDPETDTYSYVILQSRPTTTDAVRHTYVLYSDPTSDYEDEIFKYLENNNIELPVAVAQGDECAYPENTETPVVTERPPVVTRLEPVKDFDLDKLLGRWYEVLTNENSEENHDIFGDSEDGVCNILTFCSIDINTVSVYEQYWLESSYGEMRELTGRAELLRNESAVFNVTMTSQPSQTVVAVLLDTTPDGSLYSYIVFTDPTGDQLKVIARDVNEFEENNEVDVIGWLLDHGFTEESTKPQIVYQDSSCPKVAEPSSLEYPGSGCQPERSSSSASSFIVPIVVVALVAGVALAVVASYYISKRKKTISYNSYGQF